MRDTSPFLETILELHYVVGEVAAVKTVSIRSGMTAGEVILMEGDDYVGHCVNVASRLCDLAGAGEALAAPAVRIISQLGPGCAGPTSNCAAWRSRCRPRASGSPHDDAGGSHDPICGLR